MLRSRFQIRVSHDNTGKNPAWHLSRVTVSGGSLQRPVSFPCKQWIKAGQLTCTLEPSASVERSARYNFRIYTGSAKGSGSDATVSFQVNPRNRVCHACETIIVFRQASTVQVYGVDGSCTGAMRFEGGPDTLNRGEIDTFDAEESDVGDVERLIVSHDGRGRSGGWYLDMVPAAHQSCRPSLEAGNPLIPGLPEQVELEVIGYGVVDLETQRYTLMCQAWLNDEAGLQRTLRPTTRGTDVCTYVVKVSQEGCFPSDGVCGNASISCAPCSRFARATGRVRRRTQMLRSSSAEIWVLPASTS